MELYRKYRPRKLESLVGNEQTVSMIEKFASRTPEKRPHSYLLQGSAGCGKTTLAYIIAKMYGCSVESIEEYNSASFRGIDSVREIQMKMQRKPVGDSKCRVFILEEAHQFTKDAMEALLKPTENCPNHVYFFLTTTNPEKLGAALKTRMTVINLQTLGDDDLVKIMKRVVKLEGAEIVNDTIYSRIAEIAAGSARVALTTLEKVLALPTKEQKRFETIIESTQTKAIDLCRLLMKRPKWKEVSECLKTMLDDPESVRWAVLGYATAVLLGGNKEAYNIILAFEENYWSNGKAGLAKSCYEYIFGTEPVK